MINDEYESIEAVFFDNVSATPIYSTKGLEDKSYIYAGVIECINHFNKEKRYNEPSEVTILNHYKVTTNEQRKIVIKDIANNAYAKNTFYFRKNEISGFFFIEPKIKKNCAKKMFKDFYKTLDRMKENNLNIILSETDKQFLDKRFEQLITKYQNPNKKKFKN